MTSVLWRPTPLYRVHGQALPLTAVSDEGHLTALFVARKPIVGGKGVRRSVQLNS